MANRVEPNRSALGRVWRRRFQLALLPLAPLALAACSSSDADAFKRLALPVGITDRTDFTHDLWIGSWIAAGIVGVFVWFLIGYAALHFRRRTSDMPKQNRYNLPMEILYTGAPFIIIGVLFYYTVVTQDRVLAKSPESAHTLDVVGQKWSWTFNYREADNPAVGEDVWEAGTINKTPDLYLPVGKSIRFNLSSPDVIHSFWIPSFYQKLDIVPGRVNSFEATPEQLGVYRGKCTEFCGTYHSAMLFNVRVVSEAEYNAYLKTLVARGQTGVAKGPRSDVPGSVKATPGPAGGSDR